MKNTHENADDMQKMQQEAIRRVQEMQSRAKMSLEGKQHVPEQMRPSQGQQSQNSSREPEPQKESHHTAQKESPAPSPAVHSPPSHHSAGKSDMITDIFASIMKDSERNLILLLILILVGEQADTSLILALMYLMM